MKAEDKQKANIRNNYGRITETHKEPLHGVQGCLKQTSEETDVTDLEGCRIESPFLRARVHLKKKE